jgi:hypothetical protein
VDLRLLGIAVLTGFDPPLRLAQSSGADKDDGLFLRGWIEEVMRHRGRILSPWCGLRLQPRLSFD